MELLFSEKMADRLPERPQSPFRGSQAYFKTFHEASTIFLRGQRIGSNIGSVSWSIQHRLMSSFKQRDIGEIFVGFQGRWRSIYYFFDSQIFLRSSRYFSSIVISINFYHVECGDGRQPRILVDNFWIPRSKTRTCSTPGFHRDMAEPWYYFFSH